MGKCFWCNQSLGREWRVVGDVVNFCSRKCVKEWQLRTPGHEQNQLISNLKHQQRQRKKAEAIADKKAEKARKARAIQRKREQSARRRQENIAKEKEAIKKVASTTAKVGAATVVAGTVAAIAAKKAYDKNKESGKGGCGCVTLFILSSPLLIYASQWLHWTITG